MIPFLKSVIFIFFEVNSKNGPLIQVLIEKCFEFGRGGGGVIFIIVAAEFCHYYDFRSVKIFVIMPKDSPQISPLLYGKPLHLSKVSLKCYHV